MGPPASQARHCSRLYHCSHLIPADISYQPNPLPQPGQYSASSSHTSQYQNLTGGSKRPSYLNKVMSLEPLVQHKTYTKKPQRTTLKLYLKAAGSKYTHTYFIFLSNTTLSTDSMKQNTSTKFCVKRISNQVSRTSKILLWLFKVVHPVSSTWHLNLC